MAFFSFPHIAFSVRQLLFEIWEALWISSLHVPFLPSHKPPIYMPRLLLPAPHHHPLTVTATLVQCPRLYYSSTWLQ